MLDIEKHHIWGGFVSSFAATVFLSFFVIMAMYSFSIHDDTSGVAFLMTAGIFLLIFLIFIPMLFILFRKRTIAKNAFLTLPEQKAEGVRVINKSRKTVGNRYSTSTIFYVTFELPDGERKCLNVVHDDYAILEDGDIGTLIYKEGGGYKFFVEFRRTIRTESP